MRYQAGSARAILTIEERVFTQWYPLQLFRVGGAVFADVGRAWGRPATGGPGLGLLKDIGVGLRLGNSRSALGNVVHVDLAIPLDRDASIRSVQMLIGTHTSF